MRDTPSSNVGFPKDDALYKSLFEENFSVMLLIDPATGEIKDANRAACRYYGWSHGQICTMNISEINTLSVQGVKEVLSQAATENRTHFFFNHRLANGEIRDVEVFTTPNQSDHKQPIFSIIHDITDRKRIESQLEMLKATIDAASDGAYWMDVKGRFVYVNNSGCAMLGYTRAELLTMDVFAVNAKVTPELWAKIWDGLRTDKKYTSESVHRRKDGTEFPVEIASTYFKYNNQEYVNGFARDITARKRMEEELLVAQKLEALGLLAGGIAHDFNNLMGGIFGYIDLAHGELKNSAATGYLTKAMNTIERARGLTQQLLTFAKGGTPIKKVEALFPLIHETAQFALSGSDVSLRVDIPDNLWSSKFDRTQIGQVIDNIVINAAAPFWLSMTRMSCGRPSGSCWSPWGTAWFTKPAADPR